MKFNFIELIRSAFVKRDQKFRQHLTVFFICLLISIFVWLTVKMDNEYQEIIPLPVKFTSPPRSSVLVDASDSVIFVELSEKGSELLRYRYSNARDTLEVSTKNVILTQRPGRSTGYILTSSLFDEVGYQHDLAGRIVSISPDTIYLEFKKEAYKKVPVTANLQIKTQQQHMLYGQIDYEPDSVVLRGPEEILNAISEASLGDFEYNDLDQTTQTRLPVIVGRMNEYITAVPKEVLVTIPVEKFTEKTIEVPVSILSDTSIRIRLFPDVVSINCLVALKDYTTVTPGMIKAVADFRTIDTDTEKEIRIKVIESPSTLKINRIEPEKAEFIIIK